MSQFIEMFEDHNYTSVPLAELIDKSFSGEWGTEDENGNGTKVIRTTNITNSDKLDLSDVVTRNIVAAKLQKKQLCKGDILLERSGGTKDNPVGRVAYFDEDGVFVTNNFTQTLRCNDNIESRYLFYFLYYFYNLNKMKIRSMGNQTTGIQNLNMDDYMQISVIVPPRDLQKQFISIVTQADKSKFVGFKSQFIEMFGACTHNVYLSTLCNVFIDGDWIESKDQSDVGIRLIQTGNIGDGYFRDKDDKARYISEQTFEHLKCTEVFPNDILISRLPDPIGRACVIPDGIGKSITAVDCTIVRLSDKILPEFFVAYTKTPMYHRQINEVATGTTRRRVSRANLGNIKITCPSLDKQQQFVDIVNQADKSKYFS